MLQRFYIIINIKKNYKTSFNEYNRITFFGLNNEKINLKFY